MLNQNNVFTSDVSNKEHIDGSTAYSFLDNYMYSRNASNAAYDQQKSILQMENYAIKSSSVAALYDCLCTQTKALGALVVRIRNFSQLVRQDVIQNIDQLIPDISVVNKFLSIIKTFPNIPREKCLKYNIWSISYPNMASFYGLFGSEISNYTKIDPETSRIDDPFIHKKATDWLIKNTEKYLSKNNDILYTESFMITTPDDLRQIGITLSRKAQLTSAINRDFRTFYFYLREYKFLDKIMADMRPHQLSNGTVHMDGYTENLKSFSDYMVLYKHYVSMIKHMTDVCAYYNAKFFNKIYAIQANIEIYTSIMRNVFTYYKDGIRNNESFELDDMILGRNQFSDQLNDSIEEPSTPKSDLKVSEGLPDLLSMDTVDKKYVDPNAWEDPETAFDCEYEPDGSGVTDDPDTNEVGDAAFDSNSYYAACTGIVGEVRDTIGEANVKLESFHPIDVMNNNISVMLEAEEQSNIIMKAIDNIGRAIKSSAEKFSTMARKLFINNEAWLKKADKFDVYGADLASLEYEMFDYRTGIGNMNRIKIPAFKESDVDLLLSDGGKEYKKRYFSECYDLRDQYAPITKTFFRGSKSKIKVTPKIAGKYYDFYINYLREYKGLTRGIAYCNAKIHSALKSAKNYQSESTGDTASQTEAVLINRSIFKDEIYDIMLEDGEATGVQPDASNTKETDHAKDMVSAIKMYSKICYEVNSTRMDIYEDAYTEAVNYITKVMKLHRRKNPEVSPMKPTGMDDKKDLNEQTPIQKDNAEAPKDAETPKDMESK